MSGTYWGCQIKKRILRGAILSTDKIVAISAAAGVSLWVLVVVM